MFNTNVTTKHQRKLGGAIVNGLVLGVNELADGKAITAVEDRVSHQCSDTMHSRTLSMLQLTV